MSVKSRLEGLFHRAPAAPAEQSEQAAATAEELSQKLAAAELETRFREAITSGKISGDILTVDEAGNIVHSTRSTNIFDL